MGSLLEVDDGVDLIYLTQEIQHVYQLLDGAVEPKQRKTRTPRN
jgi:hypothetical protein